MLKSNFSSFAKNFNLNNSNLKDSSYSISFFRIEILAGLTVAIALVPEAVAFAFVAEDSLA